MTFPSKGIALVMVAAILVFLALLAASLLHVSRFLGRSAVVARVSAGNAAYAGTEYALSRLSRNPVRSPDALKADSWFVTPAYTHGEPYEDLDGDGAFGAGEPFTDADGDGRADLYTGRLRPSGAWDCRFSLDLNGALVSVNSGSYHFLNMLGAVLGEKEPEDLFGEYVAPTATGEDIFLSDLGTRIVAGRPYLSLEEVKERAGLTEREWSILARYLTLSGTQPPLCLNGTPAEILEATYRYRASRGRSHQFPNLPAGTDPHTGLAFSDVVVLAREEAASLGREIARRVREDPFESWDAFWQFLDANRDTLFPYPEIGGAAERAAFQRVRALLAFWNGNPNPSPYVGIEASSPKGAVHASVPSWTWGRWPQESEPMPVGANYFIKSPPYAGDQPYDGTALNDSWWVPSRHLGVPTLWSVSSAGEVADGNQRLGAVSEEGEFETARTLYLTSQEDFENLTAQAPPWGAGTPRALGHGVVAEGWATKSRVASLPQFPKDAFDSGPAYGTTHGALTLSAYPNIPGVVVPPPDIAVRFDQTTPPPPDTAWEDNVTEQQTGEVLSFVFSSALNGSPGANFGKCITAGGNRQCEVYPFWTFTALGSLFTNTTSWYFEAGEFPGRDDAVLDAGSGILTEIRSLEQATIECWVTELDPPEKNAAIWALRAGLPGGVENPPYSGLLLRRDGGGRYQLLWHGPYVLWYEEDFSHVWGETLLASWRPPEWQAWEDNPIANPYPIPRMRQVTLVLDHDRNDPAASRPLLYVDGIEATAAGWIDEFEGLGSYPVPLRWTRSNVWELGPLIDPEEPWIVNPTWGDWWTYIDTKFPWDQSPTREGSGVGQVCMSLQCDEFFLWKSVLSPFTVASRTLAPRFQTAGGSFRSPRYTLPEDARPILASWTGVQTASALAVTLNGRTAGGAPAFPPRTLPAGTQSLFSPEETNEADLRALDFTVTWGSTSGPAGRLDPSVFEDLLVQYAPRSGPRRLR